MSRKNKNKEDKKKKTDYTENNRDRPNESSVPINQSHKEAFNEQGSGQDKENESHETAASNKEKWNTSDRIQAAGVIVNTLILIGAAVAIFVSNKSVRVVEKMFRVQNMPYLQISDIGLNGDTVFYSINNFGQYPAKIIDGRIVAVEFNFDSVDNVTMENLAITEGPDIRTDSQGNPYIHSPNKKIFDSTLINTYVVKEYPVRRYEIKMKSSYQPKQKYYFLGELIYTNEADNTRRKYIFNILLPQIEFLSNKNFTE